MRIIPSLLFSFFILSCNNPDIAANQADNQPQNTPANQDQIQTNLQEPADQQEKAPTQDAVASLKADAATATAATPTNTDNTKNETAIPASSGLVFGKYGCTASKYVNGSYEYTPRGYFTISSNGEYVYDGLDKPSKGSFTVDSEGNLHFKGGYFDQGKAEKIDRPNKFFLVFPTIPDNRWTCGLVDEKR